MPENTRSAICDTARRLTIDKGLSAFTVEELCEQVGISRRTFFNYFPTKEDAVLDHSEDHQPKDLMDAFLATAGSVPLLRALAELAASTGERLAITREEFPQMHPLMQPDPQLLVKLFGDSAVRHKEFAALIARQRRVEATATSLNPRSTPQGTSLSPAAHTTPPKEHHELDRPDGNGAAAADPEAHLDHLLRTHRRHAPGEPRPDHRLDGDAHHRGTARRPPQGRHRGRLRKLTRAGVLVPRTVPGHRPGPGDHSQAHPLSETSGMVARGEAIGGEDAERLEREQASVSAAGTPANGTGGGTAAAADTDAAPETGPAPGPDSR